MNRTRAAVVCLSLANLCHLSLWSSIFSSDFRFYLRDSAALTAGLTAALISIFAMAGVGFVVFLLARTHPALHSVARWACFMVLTIPVWTGIGFFVPGLFRSVVFRYLLAELLGFGLLAVVWGKAVRFRHACYTATALAVLALPLFTLRAVALINRLPKSPLQTHGLVSIDAAGSASTPGQIPPNSGQPRRTRVVWLLFDELDEYITFEAKAGVPALREFERLRQTSFHATAAAAANYITVAAVPSMFLGHALSTDEATALDGHEWRDPQGLFPVLHREGISTALLGWYLPYCTMLGTEVTRCYSVLETAASPRGISPVVRTLRQWREIGRSIPLLAATYRAVRTQVVSRAVLPSVDQGRHREAFDLLRGELAGFLTGPYDVVYVHWPLPHLPGIGRRDAAGRVTGDYLDNLRLADESLGEMRKVLQEAKLWDDSIVVVSGDHHFRANMWRNDEGIGAALDKVIGQHEHPRVPVLIKMPHQTAGSTYDKPFSMLLMRDLILGLSGGAIAAANDIAPWLDANRGRFTDLRVPEAAAEH